MRKTHTSQWRLGRSLDSLQSRGASARVSRLGCIRPVSKHLWPSTPLYLLLLLHLIVTTNVVQQPLLTCKNRDLTKNFANFLECGLDVWQVFDILAQNPEDTAECLARFDLCEGLRELVAYRLSEVRELLDDFAVVALVS